MRARSVTDQIRLKYLYFSIIVSDLELLIFSSWYMVNLVLNMIIYRQFYAWWTKYNYVLAAALDTGLALSGIVIFVAIICGLNVQFLVREYCVSSARLPLQCL